MGIQSQRQNNHVRAEGAHSCQGSLQHVKIVRISRATRQWQVEIVTKPLTLTAFGGVPQKNG